MSCTGRRPRGARKVLSPVVMLRYRMSRLVLVATLLGTSVNIDTLSL